MKVKFLSDVTLGAPAPERVLAGDERDLPDATAQALIALGDVEAVDVAEPVVEEAPRKRGRKAAEAETDQPEAAPAITELGPDGQPVDGGG